MLFEVKGFQRSLLFCMLGDIDVPLSNFLMQLGDVGLTGSSIRLKVLNLLLKGRYPNFALLPS